MINQVFIHGRVLAHPCTWDTAASPAWGQRTERPVMATPPRACDWTQGASAEPHGSLGGHAPRGSEHAGWTLISETNIWGFPLCPLPEGHARYRGACTWPEMPRARLGRWGPRAWSRVASERKRPPPSGASGSQRPGLRHPRRPKGKLKSTPEQCSQPSPQSYSVTFHTEPNWLKTLFLILTASGNSSAHSVTESNIPLKSLAGLPREAEFLPLAPRGEERGTSGPQQPRPNAGSARGRAGWSAPASQPLTTHRAPHDLPGQHPRQPEHLHFDNQRENLLLPCSRPTRVTCTPSAGHQGWMLATGGRRKRGPSKRGRSTVHGGSYRQRRVRRQGACARRQASRVTPLLGPVIPRSKEDTTTAQGWISKEDKATAQGCIICTCAHPCFVCPHMLLKENISETSFTTASERCAKPCWRENSCTQEDHGHESLSDVCIENKMQEITFKWSDFHDACKIDCI